MIRTSIATGLMVFGASTAVADTSKPENGITWEDYDIDIVKSVGFWEEGPEVDIAKDDRGEFWEGGPEVDVFKSSLREQSSSGKSPRST